MMENVEVSLLESELRNYAHKFQHEDGHYLFLFKMIIL